MTTTKKTTPFSTNPKPPPSGPPSDQSLPRARDLLIHMVQDKDGVWVMAALEESEESVSAPGSARKMDKPVLCPVCKEGVATDPVSVGKIPLLVCSQCATTGRGLVDVFSKWFGK